LDLGITNKIALVRGGGGGLGGAIAKTLAQEGARVIVADIDEAAANRTAQAIGDQSKAWPMAWDIGNLPVLQTNVKSIEDRWGGIDILVNNTGGPPPTPVAGQDPGVWTSHFQSMVLSVISITDRVLPGMRERKWGRIITSTSSGVVAPIPNLGISNSLRLSLVGWSKTLAKEVGRGGITSNIILPGRIGTQRIRFLDEQKAKRENRSVDSVAAESASSIAVGRYGAPEEYADAVAFLASARASYITGSVIRVDGGLITSI
jgi:3-oxoacyl-[acyl-carrier protein] reductase